MGCLLYLDGILQTREFNDRDDSQVFKFNPVGLFDGPILSSTFFILTFDRKLAIDLKNSARLNEK